MKIIKICDTCALARNNSDTLHVRVLNGGMCIAEIYTVTETDAWDLYELLSKIVSGAVCTA